MRGVSCLFVFSAHAPALKKQFALLGVVVAHKPASVPLQVNSLETTRQAHINKQGIYQSGVFLKTLAERHKTGRHIRSNRNIPPKHTQRTHTSATYPAPHLSFRPKPTSKHTSKTFLRNIPSKHSFETFLRNIPAKHAAPYLRLNSTPSVGRASA